MGNAGQDSSVTADPDCPFCTIVQRNDPDVREVYRDDQVVAFFPTDPAVLGHTLIVPRAHVPFVWELHDEDAEHIGLLTSRMSRVIVETTGAEGLNVIQSNGHVATQSVNHVHVHLVPRWTNDAIGRIWPPETRYSEHAKDETWDALRNACRGLRL
ncbi:MULTISPECIES: HIT family protein [Kocuria]|uniref:HIT family protein n=1 Tax=Kocuria TaxID=57493 RepID=UPI00101BBEAF